jgi:prophage DNA circulation protein
MLAGHMARDASSLFNLGSLLTGHVGRYVNANVTSAFSPVQNTGGVPWTVQALACQGAQDRAAVQTAGSDLTAAAAGLDAANAANLPQAVQALIAALAAVTPNPGDTIDRLATLATYGAPPVPGNGQVAHAMQIAQDATSALVRREALGAIGEAAGNYAPSSYDDAAALRLRVAGLLDEECVIAGDAGDDASYNALRDLREAVIEATTASGGTLAPLRWWTLQASLPALTLAQQCYQDPTRTDELISQAATIHPAFMPVHFQALAS